MMKTSPKSQLRGVVKCYQCNEIDHYAKDCPSKANGGVRMIKSAKTRKAIVSKQVGIVEAEDTESENCRDKIEIEEDSIYIMNTRDEFL
ncbi:hypothetical protein P5V15_011375 [Pogonomyrmex californicus]